MSFAGNEVRESSGLTVASTNGDLETKHPRGICHQAWFQSQSHESLTRLVSVEVRR